MSISDTSPCWCTWRKSGEWPKCLDPCHPCGRPRRCSRFLALAWLSPNCCSHLRSDPAHWKSLAFSLFSLALSLSPLSLPPSSPTSLCVTLYFQIYSNMFHAGKYRTSTLRTVVELNQGKCLKWKQYLDFWLTDMWNVVKLNLGQTVA